MEKKRPVILVVSFGTSYLDSIKSSIEAIENEIAAAYPEYEIRRAFTSPKILRKLKRRNNLYIDNVAEALTRLSDEGVKTVMVQPTYIIKGYEYDDLVKDVMAFKDKFDTLRLGMPLLDEEEDYENSAKAAMEKVEEYLSSQEAVVFMGHGTEHPGNSSYVRLQKAFDKMGSKNILVATVEAKPDIYDIRDKLIAMGIKKAYLLPFMIVSGDHANNDMAGDEEGSWKMVLKNAGFEVECILKGLGEYEGIRSMIVKKTADLL